MPLRYTYIFLPTNREICIANINSKMRIMQIEVPSPHLVAMEFFFDM